MTIGTMKKKEIMTQKRGFSLRAFLTTLTFILFMCYVSINTYYDVINSKALNTNREETRTNTLDNQYQQLLIDSLMKEHYSVPPETSIYSRDTLK